MSDHVTPEQGRRLKEVGAFQGREWQVGDWFCDVEGVGRLFTGEPIMGGEKVFMGESIPYWIPLQDVMKNTYFLPRLCDMLQEIARVGGDCPVYVEYMRGNRVGGVDSGWHIWAYPHTAEVPIDPYPRFHALDLDAAYACLVAVLEAREETHDAQAQYDEG
jgi:hypothetical protein